MTWRLTLQRCHHFARNAGLQLTFLESQSRLRLFAPNVVRRGSSIPRTVIGMYLLRSVQFVRKSCQCQKQRQILVARHPLARYHVGFVALVCLRGKKWQSCLSAIVDIGVTWTRFPLAATVVTFVSSDGAAIRHASVHTCGTTVCGHRSPASCPTSALEAIGSVPGRMIAMMKRMKVPDRRLMNWPVLQW